MKLFLLFFMFFLGLSSFTVGWILRGQYRIADRDNTKESKVLKNENIFPKVKKPEAVTLEEKQSDLEKKDSSSKEEKYLQFNKEEFAKIKDQQSFFSKEGQYSFLINVFSEEKSAFAYIEKLKKRFPVWNFFIRPDKIQLRVYLGPFETKKEALNFIEKIPAPSPFPNYFLEKETFSLNEL